MFCMSSVIRILKSHITKSTFVVLICRAVLKAPLLISADVTKMEQEFLDILLNEEGLIQQNIDRFNLDLPPLSDLIISSGCEPRQIRCSSKEDTGSSWK